MNDIIYSNNWDTNKMEIVRYVLSIGISYNFLGMHNILSWYIPSLASGY